MSRFVAAAAVLVVVTVGAIVWFIPALTAKNPTMDSTPSLQGKNIRSVVTLPGRGRACIAPLPLDPRVREVQLLLSALGRASSPIQLALRGPDGYVGRARLAPIAVGGDANAIARLDRAPSGTGSGELCLRNLGRHSIGLVGTNEAESLSLPQTTVGGKLIADVDPAVTFLTGERRDVLSQTGAIASRAAGFTGALPTWLVWLLAVAFFLGLPLAVAGVLVSTTREAP